MNPHSSRLACAAAELTLLAMVTPGCAGWYSSRTESPAEFVARAKPGLVRVTLAARPDSAFLLSLPTVRGDSILGVLRTTKQPEITAVASSDIRSLETQRLSPGKSLLAVGAVALVATVVLYHLIMSYPD